MSKLAIIADDLTGANDTGVQFAKRGLKTIVLLDADHLRRMPDEEVVVMDTYSRALPPDAAYRKVVETARLFRDSCQFPDIYKKIDSTLRGNPGAEIDAIMDVCGQEMAIVAPAFPANGRITVGGYHLLHGVPLEATEISRDPVAPVRESHVPTLLARQAKRKVGHVGIKHILAGPEVIRAAMEEVFVSGMRIVVCDAWQEEHLQMIAAAAVRLEKHLLWVGSAGLAQYLPQVLGLGAEMRGMEKDRLEEDQLEKAPVVVIAGSMSEISRSQVARLQKECAVAVVEADPCALGQPETEATESGRCLGAALHAAKAGSDVVITLGQSAETMGTIHDQGRSSGLSGKQTAAAVADALGGLCRQIAAAVQLSGLVLTGGDIAISSCRHLGATGFRILEEVAPGIPAAILKGGMCDGMLVVTKAGAFGATDALVEAVAWLRCNAKGVKK
ncbi:MAG: four-carbon acid sugar kinase family protein [Syntrophales bacterium]|nr:four-carbon acid sugar kinase family protein [Syntrophales bacterium]